MFHWVFRVDPDWGYVLSQASTRKSWDLDSTGSSRCEARVVESGIWPREHPAAVQWPNSGQTPRVVERGAGVFCWIGPRILPYHVLWFGFISSPLLYRSF